MNTTGKSGNITFIGVVLILNEKVSDSFFSSYNTL